MCDREYHTYGISRSNFLQYLCTRNNNNSSYKHINERKDNNYEVEKIFNHSRNCYSNSG